MVATRSHTSKKDIKNVLKVTFSNLIRLISGVLVGFLLPKMIGVTDYGYYKTFTLYTTYVGLFAIGITDGIYLKYAGLDFDELEKTKFRFFTKLYLILELSFSLIIFVVALFLLPGELKFIFAFVSLYFFGNNAVGYYQIISQITSRFDELSKRNIIQSVLVSITVVAFWFLFKFFNFNISYRLFTLVYCVISFLLSLWYVFTYRTITFGKTTSFREGKAELVRLIASGLPLLFANLSSSLILSIDRQFVSILFDTDTYAVYAFAYNMLSLVTVATSAISTVMYPTLKKNHNDNDSEKYRILMVVVLILVFLMLVIYFPLCAFVSWFLPKYVDSLPIFRIILPGLAISSPVTIVMHNFYKKDNKELLFFLKCLLVICLSIIANLIAYYMFKTTISISIASIAVMFVWFVVVGLYFVKKYRINWAHNILFIVLMSEAFYLISSISIWWIGLIVYVFVFAIISFAVYKKDIISIWFSFHRNPSSISKQ